MAVIMYVVTLLILMSLFIWTLPQDEIDELKNIIKNNEVEE